MLLIFAQIQKLLDKKDIDKNSDDSWEDDIHSKHEIESQQTSGTITQLTLKIIFSSLGEFRLIGNLPETALVNKKNFKSERQFHFKTDGNCVVIPGGGNPTGPQKQSQNREIKPEIQQEFD